MNVTTLKELFWNNYFKPSTNARGWQIELRQSAINTFRQFLQANRDKRFEDAVSYNL